MILMESSAELLFEGSVPAKVFSKKKVEFPIYRFNVKNGI